MLEGGQGWRSRNVGAGGGGGGVGGRSKTSQQQSKQRWRIERTLTKPKERHPSGSLARSLS